MSSLELWLGVGVLARFLLDGLVSAVSGARLPLGTLVVNLSGTVALGVLVGVGLHGDAYLLGATAVIGSYTTFSTWLYESHRLAEGGERWLVLANVGLSVVLGIAAAELGRTIGSG
jgi:CrcB protein